MYGERLQSERPFEEYTLSEIDLSLMSHREAAEWLGELAAEHNFGPEKVLYCGIDAQSVVLNGTFGNRTETWAVTTSQLLAAADKASYLGDWDTDSPFYYALLNFKPGIVMLDRSKFENLETTHPSANDVIRSDLEYRLKQGVAMDEAVIAVAYITS